MTDPPDAPMWVPSAERTQQAEISRYLAWLNDSQGRTFDSYEDLRRWSIDDLAGFWSSIWSYFDVVAAAQPHTILPSNQMPGAHWFGGARLNYAANALRGPDSCDALVGISEGGAVRTLTYGDLREYVAAVACGLRELGVVQGDVVATYLPNVIEAAVCLLACAAIGAVFCLCSPEYGLSGALARLGPLRPRVLVAADGYVYAGKEHHRLDIVQALCGHLEGLRHLVILPMLGEGARHHGAVPTLTWPELCRHHSELEIKPVAFEHPLWVLFSSGTTGKPKAIVHGHGGIVLEHLKSLALHRDVRPGDRVMWLTSPGWMMWNYILGSLLAQATVVLLDGSPAYPGVNRPWQIASEQAVHMLGAGASYFEVCRRAELRPGEAWDLHNLRSVGATGSALSGAGYDWVYGAVKPDVMLSPASGGTEVCSAFVGPCPLLPLWREEMQCRMLGVSAEAFDRAGRPLIDQAGELVVTRPMPSMPLYLWGDPAGHRLTENYFTRFPGIWTHGDRVLITSRGTAQVLGRSDATLNRGGIRLGADEYYALLGQRPDIADSLIVDVATQDTGSELILFVVPVSGIWSDRDATQLKAHIRAELSPRHVPDHIYPLRRVPRTLSGKRLEVPVKRIMHGEQAGSVLDLDAVAYPESITEIVAAYRQHKLHGPPRGRQTAGPGPGGLAS